MENPIKMDDLGVPLFLETPIFLYQMAMNPMAGIRNTSPEKHKHKFTYFFLNKNQPFMDR